MVASERMESVRSVALGCVIGAGSALEPLEVGGISHLLEHMLFRGTRRHRSGEIDEIFDEMGSELSAETGREATSLSTRVLDHNLARALEVIGEMLWHPAMEQLQAEREIVLEEIAAYEDDPGELVFDVLGEAIFAKHPLGRRVIGTIETVSAIEEPQLRAYHQSRYLPGNVVIAAAGSVDHDHLVEAVRALAPDARADDGARAPSSTPVPQARSVRFVEKATEQYHLCLGGLGLCRADERRFTLRVLEGVLGASASSRLFREVRERRGLAYSIFSFSSMHAHAGEIGIYVGTREERLVQALETILAELHKIIAEPVSARELDRAKESMKGRIALALESTGMRMARLADSLLHDLPLLSVDETIARIDAVQAEDVRALAAQLLDPARLSAAVIGPQSAALSKALETLSSDAQEALAA